MCEYCRVDKTDNPPIIECAVARSFPDTGVKFCAASISGDLLFLDSDFEYKCRKINYCPMCGRKLEEVEDD